MTNYSGWCHRFVAVAKLLLLGRLILSEIFIWRQTEVLSNHAAELVKKMFLNLVMLTIRVHRV